MISHVKRSWFSDCSAPSRCAVVGALAALASWAVVEPFFCEGASAGRIGFTNVFFFPIVVGTVSGALALAQLRPEERFTRGLTMAAASFGLCFAAAFLLQGPAYMLFGWLRPGVGVPFGDGDLESRVCAIAARGLAWALITVAIGMRPGLASAHGGTYFIAMGGAFLGGLAAGISFEPVHGLLHASREESAWLSRMAGFLVVGGMAGFFSGVAVGVQTGARLLIASGPMAGTLIFLGSDRCLIGSSSECEVVLEDGSGTKQPYSVIEKAGFAYELAPVSDHETNGLPQASLGRMRLAHGDRVRVGNTDLIFFRGPHLSKQPV